MKLNYDLIKKNLATYAEAKELFPVISDYERGEVSISVMRNIGLQEFGEFYDFLKRGDNPVEEGMTWRKLKLMIAEKTNNVRLKKFIMNRTQRQFNEILMDGPQFDRLLNGRWISKPTLTIVCAWLASSIGAPCMCIDASPTYLITIPLLSKIGRLIASI